MRRKFLTLTTSSVQGLEIAEYYGYVSCNLVVGANFIRDNLAGVRDIFGGVSKAYTREIDRLKEMARINLENKAKLVGMNGIIGFQADIDTVGATMFMISATGTAVRFVDIPEVYTEEESLSENNSFIKDIEAELYNYYKEESGGVSEIQLDFAKMSVYELEEYLADVSDDCKLSVIESLLEYLCNKTSSYQFQDDKSKVLIIKEFILRQKDNNMFKYLNSDITREKSIAIKVFDLIDYVSVLNQFNEIKSKENELDLLNCLDSKPKSVSKEQYLALCKLIEFIETKYNDNVEIKVIGTIKKKQTWICKSCKANVEMDRDVCSLCDTDRYGLKLRTERFKLGGELIKLKNKINHLKGIRDVLKVYYDN